MIPTPYFKPYANALAVINCLVDDPAACNRPACGVVATTAGTLVLRPVGGPIDGSLDRTENLIPGLTLWVRFDSIRSGTATNFTLYWPNS